VHPDRILEEANRKKKWGEKREKKKKEEGTESASGNLFFTAEPE